MSEIVNKSFEGAEWERGPFPTQEFPEEVQNLLDALDATRAHGWLSAESHIRNFDEEGRNNLARALSDLRQTLNRVPARYFVLLGDSEALFIWLQQHDSQIDWVKVNDKASAAALTANSSKISGIMAEVSADGFYHRAQSFAIQMPTAMTQENANIYDDAARMTQASRAVYLPPPPKVVHPPGQKMPGRNEPCPCGSGLKFKKCHDR